MNCLLPPPTQLEFETELEKIVERGEQEIFARYLRQTPTYVGQMLNASHPRESIPYRFAEWVWAGDALHRSKGDRMLDLVLRHRGNWLVNEVPVAAKTAHLTKEIGVQFSEFLDAELNKLPIDDQIRECDDIRRAAEAKLNALRRRKALEYASK